MKFAPPAAFDVPSAWESPRNPLSLDIGEQTYHWLRDVGTPDESGQLDYVARRFDPALYSGLVFPTARDSRFVRAASDFSIWETLLDDRFETLAVTLDEAGRQALADDVVHLLSGSGPLGLLVEAYVPGWRDLGGRLDEMGRNLGGEAWAVRFRRATELTFRTVITRTPRASQRWFTLEEYAQVRPWECNFLMYLPLAELGTGAFCPAEMTADPRHDELFVMAGMIFGLMNDSLSTFKEGTGAPVLNAVLIHQHHNGTELAHSVAEIARWHSRCVNRFMDLADDLTRDYGLDARRYLAEVRRTTAGITAWTRSSPRYSREWTGH